MKFLYLPDDDVVVGVPGCQAAGTPCDGVDGSPEAAIGGFCGGGASDVPDVERTIGCARRKLSSVSGIPVDAVDRCAM